MQCRSSFCSARSASKRSCSAPGGPTSPSCTGPTMTLPDSTSRTSTSKARSPSFPSHPLAARDRLTLAEVRDVSDLPIARWPQLDGTYPDGPGTRGTHPVTTRSARGAGQDATRHTRLQPRLAVARTRRGARHRCLLPTYLLTITQLLCSKWTAGAAHDASRPTGARGLPVATLFGSGSNLVKWTAGPSRRGSTPGSCGGAEAR